MKELGVLVGMPNVWENREEAERLNKELGVLRDELQKVEVLKRQIDELEVLAELAHEGNGFGGEFEEKLILCKNEFETFEKKLVLTGKYDRSSAVLSIYSGAGGQDAQDWVGMLKEMYVHYGERRGWKVSIIDETLGEYASKTGRYAIKNVTMEIRGVEAYGYLKGEAGVHRLVRISPFSAKQLRHTSFALVEVLPELSDIDEQSLEVKPEDLKVELSRSSGPGGQNVNKRETAVRIVHLPTGISAASQVERSQAQNKERAMKVLKAKLYQLMLTERVKELGGLKGKTKPEWGSQIRSYVVHPYQLVKDHRTDVETSRINEVLEGNLDVFIEAELALDIVPNS
ncbi:MAG: peptide chain release factor 2 [Parcubacteria group bacterium]|nr:peptide chain release factor 2 [Parcubacteria group bacterium]